MAESEWVTLTGAAEILGVSRQVMKTVVKAGGVTVRRLPGARPQFLRADVERLARDTVTAPKGGIGMTQASGDTQGE